MRKYIVERSIPEAGKMTPEQLKEISRKSNDVLIGLGPDLQWVQSYVTPDKVYCLYNAKNPELIREHASRCGDLPVDRISEVRASIDPATGEA